MINQNRTQRSFLSRVTRAIIKGLFHPFMHVFDRPDYICYYPAFDRREDLVNHYFRARWYLPAYTGVCKRVMFIKAFDGDNPKPSDKPTYMCEGPSSERHLIILRGKIKLWWTLLRSREILMWEKTTSLFSLLLRIAGKRVHNVKTDDLDGYEFRTYCELLWGMLPEQQRQEILEENRIRFTQYLGTLRAQGFKKAYVCGTGPTLEDAFCFDFSDGIRIMCNSVVKNKELLDHVQPHFIAAIDEVFHYGVSRYAEKFRSDLIETLKNRDLIFMALARSGFVFVANFPEIRSKTVLILDQPAPPNFDILEEFWIPAFESVLPCAMLPIAATVSDDILLLGCDGKSSSRNNEDFWAHTPNSQYDIDLVNTSHHMCHPAFDAHRQAGLYDRYNDQVALTILTGEQEYGKKYRCLRPSNTPALRGRLIGA